MIDTHCHIDLYKNPEILLDECEKSGVKVIAMTNLPSHFEMGYPYVLPYKKIRLAIGMHPLYAEQHNQEFSIFLKNVSKTSYIGEVGLDFSREGFATKEIQLIMFEKILEAVCKDKKLLSIHSRRAEKEVLNLLIEYQIEAAIFHWYSGPIKLIDKIESAGYYFSVNLSMTNSKNGIEIIKNIPIDKILTETDGPFTKIDGNIQTPCDLKKTISRIAQIKRISEVEVEKLVEINFNKLISIIK